MKKLIKVNIIVILLFSSIMIFFSSKYNDEGYWIDWGTKEGYSEEIFLRNTSFSGDDLYTLLSSLADEYNINLIKTDFLTVDDEQYTVKSVYIGDSDDDIFETTTLINGHWLSQEDNQKDQYLSTKKNADKKVNGKIFDFLDDNNVEIWSLYKFKLERGTLDGDYIVRSDNMEQVASFVNELSNRSGMSLDDLTKPRVFSFREQAPIEIISKIGLVIGVLIFALFCVYYAVHNTRKIGVMKLNGYKNRTIWSDLSIDIFSFMIFSIIIENILLRIFIENLTRNFILHIFQIQVTLLGILMILSLSIYLIIRKNKISDLLKNKKQIKLIMGFTYGIKNILLILLVLVFVFICSGLEEINHEYNKTKEWEKASEFGVLVNVNVGDDGASIQQGDTKLEYDFADYYEYLNLKGAIYARTSELVPHVQFKTKFNEKTESYDYVDYFDPNIVPQSFTATTIQINPNYLKKFPIEDLDGKQINLKETDERTILIPSSMKEQEKELVELYTADYIYGIKSQERRIGQETTDIPNVLINSIIYQENNNGYFTFNSEYEDSNFMAKDVIFEVVPSGKMLTFEKSNSYVQGIDSPLKINLNGESSANFNKNIQSTLINFNLDDNYLRYMTIGEVFATQINMIKVALKEYLVGLGIIFLLLIFTTTQIAKMLIEINKKRYCIKKLYGFSFFDRFKKLLLINFCVATLISILSIIIGIQVINSEINNMIYIIIPIVPIVDYISTSICLIYFENKSLVQLVKGE